MTVAPTPAPSVRHLGCAACGATLVRREDQRVVKCRACGNRSVLAGVEVARRFQVVPKVARERAVAIVRGALATWPVREGVADEAAFVATELFWIPVQEFEALQAGTVVRDRGKKHVRGGHVDWSQGRQRFIDEHGREIEESEYYRLRPGRIFDTAVVLRTHRDTALAGGPDGWGLDAIDLRRLRDDPDVEIVPFGAREAPRGVVLPVQRTRAQAEDAVRAMAGAFGAAEMDFLGADLRHVYVPVWVVRYRVDRHPYAFVVDGVSGVILSGRAPEAARRGVLFVVCAAAYLGFPLGKLVGVAMSSDGRSLGQALGAAAHLAAEFGFLSLAVPVLLLLPLALAWGEFRFRGEVVFRPGGACVEKLARPARTFLEKVIDWLLAQIDRAVENMASRRSEDGSW